MSHYQLEIVTLVFALRYARCGSPYLMLRLRPTLVITSKPIGAQEVVGLGKGLLRFVMGIDGVPTIWHDEARRLRIYVRIGLR